MKTTPKQNRVLIPILIVVLAALVSRMVSILRDDDIPPPVVTPAQAVASGPSSARPLAQLHTATARDPFFHPSLLKTDESAPGPISDPRRPHGIAADPPQLKQPGWQSPGGQPVRALSPGIAPPSPIDMMAPDPSSAITQNRQYGTPSVPQPGAGGKRAAPSGQPASPTATATGAAPLNELVARLKLKAILAGARPAAVIEGYRTEPLIAHQGETFGGLKVEAIHAGEIVVSGAQSIWTLPLETTAAETGTQSDARKEDNIGGTH